MIPSMMAGLLYLIFGKITVHIPSLVYMMMYLTFGVMSVRFLLPRHRPLNRIWLGLSLGLLEEMWLPALFAFFFGFTVVAHTAAAGLLMVITLLCYFGRDKRDPVRWDRKECTYLVQMLLVVLPLTILGAYLQYTHVMRVDDAGNWHVGQSTYGDLPMHMSFITNLVGKKFPADYPLYPGVRLGYPFLTDTLSSTFYLLGARLQVAIIIPAVMMMFLCYMGVMVLAREMTTGKKAVVLVALLFFLNGGLGFIYNFDLAGGQWNVDTITQTEDWMKGDLGDRMKMLKDAISDQDGQIFSGYFSKVSERLDTILNGYYKTPTNQPDPYNLRWSNVICDLMVPQRTLLGGWCMVIPCFYLFSTAMRPRRVFEATYEKMEGGLSPSADNRALILLAIWAGALPLIHTHSFLALALMSLGAMIYDLIHGDPKELMIRRSRLEILLRYGAYGMIAAALALPQLSAFTFNQAFGASGSFLGIHFNWVNIAETRYTGSTVVTYDMKDLYLWFYIKNIGIPFLILLLALFEKNPRHRRIFAMVLPVVLAAELIRFQRNEYDNNKMLYLAWLMGCMIVADWCAVVWHKLKGLRGRGALAVLMAIVTFTSAGLTIWRECRSDYQAFSANAVEAGEFARDWTSPDAVYLTGSNNHLNPVSSIGGKTIVCGDWSLWLHWHGIDARERMAEVEEFYEDPDHHADILQKYDVDYIYVSRYERENYDLNEEALIRDYPVVFENHEATIYQVPEG